MLSCPPTRLNLAASDIADFERRFASRQSSRLANTKGAAGLRIRPSAGHLTKLGFVPAHANLGRRRAESCSSQATVCTDNEEQSDVGNTKGASPADHTPPSSSSNLPSEKPRDLNCHASVHNPPQGPSIHVERIAQPHYPGPPRIFLRHDSTTSPVINVDERRLLAVVPSPQPQHDRQLSTTGSEATSARPQSRQISIHEPTTSQAVLNMSLDPGAPVFVPRMRFGSTTSLSTVENGTRLATQSSTVGDPTGIVNLRARSSFERNTQHSAPTEDRTDSVVGIAITTVPPNPAHHSARPRRNDQNTAIPRPIPGLDRFPIVRPPRNSSGSSGSHRQVVFPRRRSSRQHLLEFERSRRHQDVTTEHETDVPIVQSHLTVPTHDRHRPVSPAYSTSSRSTPNLLHTPLLPVVHARSSSLSWKSDVESADNLIPEAKEPQSAVVEHATREKEADAFDIHWLNRDSPLDELTQQLDRLTARPRSVGRSFERPPGRQSLLAGDPFQVEVHHERPMLSSPSRPPLQALRQEPSAVPPRSVMAPLSAVTVLESSLPPSPSSTDYTNEDPVALALALPSPNMHSTPACRTSPHLPSTPPVRELPTSMLRSPIAGHLSSPIPHQLSSSATPSSLGLNSATTPAHFPVYDDSKPPNTQPKTPADLSRTSRRTRGRSDMAQHPRPMTTAPTPSHVPADRNPHRHTYPIAAASPIQALEQPIARQSPSRRTIMISTPSTVRLEGATVRFGSRGRGSSSENDIEGSLDGLEADRRTWMRRREGGTLDVTPPREGRFERYLS